MESAIITENIANAENTENTENTESTDNDTVDSPPPNVPRRMNAAHDSAEEESIMSWSEDDRPTVNLKLQEKEVTLRDTRTMVDMALSNLKRAPISTIVPFKSSKRKRRFWTKDEDKLLEDGVEKWGKEDG